MNISKFSGPWALALILLGTFGMHMEVSGAKASSTSVRLDVVKYKLKNGMTVLIYEDHSAPIVSVQQWYRVGSKNEKPGQTGLAHFFEHLMFKGTKKYADGQFSKTVESNGGTFNAFTSSDYTGYYVNLPSDRLEVVLDIESDRMTNLLFDPKTIDSERGVVKEERRLRTEDSVPGTIWEALFKTVYKVKEYRWPVIGYMKDLNAAKMKDFKAFYKTYYAPNNSILVIAGDVSVSKAKSLVEKYYSKIPSQKIPELKMSEEPQQRGHRTVTIKKNVQSPTFMIAFRGPKVGDADMAAMDLLGGILGSGDSSRLHKRMVYRLQLASEVWSWNYSMMDDGVFLLSVGVKPGKSLDKAIEIAYSEIYKMRTKKVSVKELEKAKNMAMMEYVSSLKTISGKARSLASYETRTGDYTNMFNNLEKYNAVTAEDIQRVAKTYLTPDKRSIIKVVPKNKEQL